MQQAVREEDNNAPLVRGVGQKADSEAHALRVCEALLWEGRGDSARARGVEALEEAEGCGADRLHGALAHVGAAARVLGPHQHDLVVRDALVGARVLAHGVRVALELRDAAVLC